MVIKKRCSDVFSWWKGQSFGCKMWWMRSRRWVYVKMIFFWKKKKVILKICRKNKITMELFSLFLKVATFSLRVWRESSKINEKQEPVDLLLKTKIWSFPLFLTRDPFLFFPFFLILKFNQLVRFFLNNQFFLNKIPK